MLGGAVASALWLATAAGVTVELSAGTEFPLALSTRAQVELPYGVLAGASVGWLPPAYVEAMREGLTATGATSAATAELIGASLESALVARAWLGIRPFAAHGLFASVGYQLIALGGRLTEREVVSAVLGGPGLALGNATLVTVGATLHQVTLEVGWRIRLPARLWLQPSLGVAMTAGAQSKLDFGGGSLPFGLGTTLAEGPQSDLDATLRQYVHLPFVALQLGWDVGRW